MIVSGNESCLFPTICRANHACVPNCTYTWNNGTQEQSMYASTEIAAGDELTVSYLPDNLVDGRHARQQFISQNYRFSCECDICQLGEGFALRQDEEDRLVARNLIGALNR